MNIVIKRPLPETIVVIAVVLAVFLPHIGRLTYFKDDWYYMYDALIAGAKVFHPLFSIDRPARGYFFELYYSLFGPAPLPYQIGALLWRILAAIGALWLFQLLWPAQRRLTFTAAVLFAIYPGYSWWVSAIEYQPMIASLALQVLSIGCTIKAIQSSQRSAWIIWLAAAIVLGWIYIALVDYAIGMEFFRVLCIFLLVHRAHSALNLWNKIIAAAKLWAWYALIPFGFLVWRVFIFHNERKATDIGLQLSGLTSAPLSTLASWLLQFISSLVNLGILAWVQQFNNFFFSLRLRDVGLALIVAALVLAIFLFLQRLLSGANDWESEAHAEGPREALALGFAGMALGILPVIAANRSINLGTYSHYALPASLAAALAVSGMIHLPSLPKLKTALISSLLVFAALAHYGIAVSAQSEESTIQRFWWQASWRIPALRAGTLLVIHYPSANIGDDGNGVQEAPNMIYFPQASAQIPVRYNLAALTLSDSNLRDVMAGKLFVQTEYRSQAVDYDYGQALVLSQPTPGSCVHVIDGTRPLVSTYDPAALQLAAASSKIENVEAQAATFTPQPFAFGAEPTHAWCYYFERADLAVQQHDWTQAAALGEQAIQRGLHPQDAAEWIPLLEAFAANGDALRVKQAAPKINADSFLRQQACARLSALAVAPTAEVRQLIASAYCRTSP